MAYMEQTGRSGAGWREIVLVLLMLAPLCYLLFLYGAPILQDRSYHGFADTRTYFGLQNFANVVSNLPFLLVGLVGAFWCYRHPDEGATRSWMVFFLGVALVFFGSGYYHRAPDDESLLWDRLPMTLAFMGLFTALVSEHLGAKVERALLVPSILMGIASVIWWKHSGDLRVYVWVQFAPLLAIPFVIAAFPGRYTHRHYLIYGVACYALAKAAEFYDYGFYALSGNAISGHTLKHVLAAAAPLCVYLMLRQRERARPTDA
jgi:Ceramidase